MDFASFAARAHAFDLHPLTPDQLRKLSRLFDRGTSMGDILSRYSRELGQHPPETWRRAREVWREHRRWREAVRAISQRRLDEGLQLLPDEAIRRTWSTAGLRLLEEASERLPLEAFPSHAAWHDALTAVADAFQGAQGVLLRQGVVHVEGELQPPAPEGVAPQELPAGDWLRARQAEAEGRATIRLEHPEEPVEQEISGPASAVAEASEGIDAAAIVRELIHGYLEEGARDALDRRAVTEAMVVACARYLERIQAPPLRSARTGSVFPGDGDRPTGVAVVGRDGRVEASEELEAAADGARVGSWLASRLGEGDPVVVPAETVAGGAPDFLTEGLEGHEVHAVHADALPRPGGKRSRAVEAARLLAQRAFRPRRSWADMAPGELDLLPPGVTLTGGDEERLEALLVEVAEPDRPEAAEEKPRKEPARKPRPQGATDPKRRPQEEELNPGVKGLRDLEPDKVLRGKVTNVNRFGAFVDVGISKEGLVPIRTLTDGFADNPDDVVRAGQRVKVRVVSVDRRRRRFEIALEGVEPGSGGGGGGGKGGGQERGKGSGGRGRGGGGGRGKSGGGRGRGGGGGRGKSGGGRGGGGGGRRG